MEPVSRSALAPSVIIPTQMTTMTTPVTVPLWRA